MPSSVVSAVHALYASIPASAFGGVSRPTLYTGEAAQTTSAAAQQRPPYGVLTDDGQTPTYDSSFGGTEGGTLRLEFFALKLDAVSGEVTIDSIARGACFGNQAPANRAGLDWGTLPLAGCAYPISLKRTKIQRGYAGFDYQGQRVHKLLLEYRVVAGIAASLAPVSPGTWTGFFGLVTYP